MPCFLQLNNYDLFVTPNTSFGALKSHFMQSMAIQSIPTTEVFKPSTKTHAFLAWLLISAYRAPIMPGHTWSTNLTRSAFNSSGRSSAAKCPPYSNPVSVSDLSSHSTATLHTLWCCSQNTKSPVVSIHERGSGASSIGKEENPNGLWIYQRGSLEDGSAGGG